MGLCCRCCAGGVLGAPREEGDGAVARAGEEIRSGLGTGQGMARQAWLGHPERGKRSGHGGGSAAQGGEGDAHGGLRPRNLPERAEIGQGLRAAWWTPTCGKEEKGKDSHGCGDSRLGL